ncbi:MAG: hypothetical protein LBH56_03340 [Coriobacteriales bacterium]|jgi:hypothetical protein|nr:hypothetical protein [Coriobacteriales bacterium]
MTGKGAYQKEAEGLLLSGFSGCKLSSFKLNKPEPSVLIAYSGKAKLEYRGAGFSIVFYRLKSASAAALADFVRMISGDKTEPRILLLPYVSPANQTLVRKRGLPFIDVAGNAWIELPGYHIDRQGYKLSRPASSSQMLRNVFSDKSTLILRLLLSGERLGVREISRRLGAEGFSVTPGYVTKVLKALGEEFFAKIDDGRYLLANKREMIEVWAADYKKCNRPQNVGLYLPARSIDDVLREVAATLDDGYALTGHAGTSLIDPFAVFDSVEVLAKSSDAVVDILQRAGAKPVERGANIQVIAPRYKVSAFYGTRDVSGIIVVSDIQLYLDLLCQPIRGLEAAEHLYQRLIAPTIAEGTESRE